MNGYQQVKIEGTNEVNSLILINQLINEHITYYIPI